MGFMVGVIPVELASAERSAEGGRGASIRQAHVPPSWWIPAMIYGPGIKTQVGVWRCLFAHPGQSWGSREGSAGQKRNSRSSVTPVVITRVCEGAGNDGVGEQRLQRALLGERRLNG